MPKVPKRKHRNPILDEWYSDDGMIRVILGDCFGVMHVLKAGSVDAIITDPPYPRKFDRVWDALGSPAFKLCKDQSFLTTLCGHYQVPRVMNACLEGGWEWFWPCIASNKNQSIMHGYKAKCCHKPCLVFRKGGVRPHRIFCDDFALRSMTQQWKASQSRHCWGQSDAIFFEPIDAFTLPGQVVCDPFVGSGTTAIVCLRLKRQFIGIEISREYFDVAKKRIQKHIDLLGSMTNDVEFGSTGVIEICKF